MLWALLLAFAVTGAPQPDLLATGQKAFQRGDFETAEQSFRAYLKTHPKSPEALSNLAAVLSRRELYDEAISLYEKALSVEPKPEIRFNLAVAQIRARRCGDAVANLRAFVKAYPVEPRGRELLGLCLVETGDPKHAVDELETVYRQKPNEPSVLFSLAYAHARAGNVERGQELVAQLASRPAQAALIDALLDYRRGRFDEARTKFEQVLKTDPNQPLALAAIGRLYLLENKDPEAISYLERAVKLSPQDAESTYQLGVLYDRTGRTADGAKLLRRSLGLRANYPDPHYQLGRIALRDKRYEEALAELQTAAKLLPNHEAIRMLLGRTYQALGNQEAARAEFAEVRRLKRAIVERDRARVESEIPLEP